jgi:hypothetical protein
VYILHTCRSPVRNNDIKFERKAEFIYADSIGNSNWMFLLRRAAEHVATSCKHTLKGEVASAQHKTTTPT